MMYGESIYKAFEYPDTVAKQIPKFYKFNVLWNLREGDVRVGIYFCRLKTVIRHKINTKM